MISITKEEFVQKCTSEFQAPPEDTIIWCDWADELHEYDSQRTNPDTGKVNEGENPVLTAEDFLDEFMVRLEVISFAYGTETAAKTLSGGCFFPWEMMNAAKYIWNGGKLEQAGKIAVDTGEFEETPDDEEEYKRLKWEMERNQKTGQDRLIM